MEYLAGFVVFLIGWLILRFLLAASYANGFAEGAWQAAHGGINRVGELARPIDAIDLEAEIDAEAVELGRHLNGRNFDAAKTTARNFGQRLVSRTWRLRASLH